MRSSSCHQAYSSGLGWRWGDQQSWICLGLRKLLGLLTFHAKMGKFQANQVELVALFGG